MQVEFSVIVNGILWKICEDAVTTITSAKEEFVYILILDLVYLTLNSILQGNFVWILHGSFLQHEPSH